MKKFRMMLPMLAFVFAVVGAIAGDFLPGITAYYKTGLTTCSTPQVTEQSNCQENVRDDRPACTIFVAPNNHPDAYKNANCTSILRVPQPE
jgi:hypothetical protein